MGHGLTMASPVSHNQRVDQNDEEKTMKKSH